MLMAESQTQNKWFYIDDFFIWLGCKFITCDNSVKNQQPSGGLSSTSPPPPAPKPAPPPPSPPPQKQQEAKVEKKEQKKADSDKNSDSGKSADDMNYDGKEGPNVDKVGEKPPEMPPKASSGPPPPPVVAGTVPYVQPTAGPNTDP